MARAALVIPESVVALVVPATADATAVAATTAVVASVAVAAGTAAAVAVAAAVVAAGREHAVERTSASAESAQRYLRIIWKSAFRLV